VIRIFLYASSQDGKNRIGYFENEPLIWLKLRCDTRFQRAFAACFDPTNVITLKTQLHAVSARWKRLSQLSLINGLLLFLDGVMSSVQNRK